MKRIYQNVFNEKAHEAINDIANKHVVCVVLLCCLSLETSLNQTLEAFCGKHILNRQMNIAFHSKCIVEGIAPQCKSSCLLIHVYQRNKDVYEHPHAFAVLRAAAFPPILLVVSQPVKTCTAGKILIILAFIFFH